MILRCTSYSPVLPGTEPPGRSARGASISLFTLFLLFTLPATPHAADLFNWQTLESGMLKVHWYEGGSEFGQQALRTAQAGLEAIGSLLPLDLEQPVEIFMYANANDLQTALAPGKEPWIAGHADPALGVIRVLIEPGPQQGITMEQRIPHELMHVLLYRYVGPGYQNLPGWLREGMAILAELYPNAEYERVLEDAITRDALIPLNDLCVSFPTNPAPAYLAYAESRSFTDYLRETYSSTGLLNLAAAYADGMDCERGTEHAFGVSLSELEASWRSSVLGQESVLTAFQNASPYLVLLCLVLAIPMIGIAGTLRKKGRQHE